MSPAGYALRADPVEAKVVASFARPGSNLTDMSLFSLDLMGKKLELLKEAMPGLTRIAIIANPEHSGEPLEFKAAQAAATKLGLSYRYFPMRSGSEVEQAPDAIARGRAEAILAFADGFTMSFAERIAAFSVTRKVPAVSGWAPFVQRGKERSPPICQSSCRRRSSW
jgi:putative ABC transport system substrate-binding protein